MAKKKESDAKMVFDIDGKRIDLDVFLGIDYRSIRYVLSCKEAMEPIDTAFCLWLIIKSICDDAGISPETLLKSTKNGIPHMLLDDGDSGGSTKH